MAHDFKASLGYEQSKFDEQDDFYYKRLKIDGLSVKKIHRINDMEKQREDMDLILTLSNGREISVSEKNRQHDYGDFLIEAYSKWDYDFGWLKKSKAEYMTYFMGNTVYWVEKSSLKNFCTKYFHNVINKETFRPLVEKFKEQSSSQDFKANIDGENVDMKLVQAYNKDRKTGKSWYTESIAVPFSCLEKHGVAITRFKFKQ